MAKGSPHAPPPAGRALAAGTQHNLELAEENAEAQYLSARARHVTKHFQSALGVDDFIQRLEVALWAYGFKFNNSIGEPNASHSWPFPHSWLRPACARLAAVKLPRYCVNLQHAPPCSLCQSLP